MEGYIEVDGQVVSKAAEKAYAYHEEKDNENRLKLEERRKKLEEISEFFRSDQAKESVRKAIREAAVQKIRTETLQGIFSSKRNTKEYFRISVYAAYEKLCNENPVWMYLDPYPLYYIEDVGLDKEFDVFLSMRSSVWNDLGHYPNAPHYLQYFNLKGKVMLPLSEYQRLLPYMEDTK